MYKSIATNKLCNRLLIFIFSILYAFNKSKRQNARRKYKSIYKNYKLNQIVQIIRNKYKDHYCIFTRNGIGDIYFVASLINEFKKINGNKVAFFTDKKSLIPLLQAFPSIDSVYYDNDLKILQEYQVLQRSIVKGQLNRLFFPYRGPKDTYTFADNYNNLLDLPLNIKRENPIIKTKNINKAQQEFLNLRLYPDKTILIIPDATMFDYRTISPNFWLNLADKLIQLGYEVIFNTNLNIFKKYKTTFLPIMDFVAFTEKIKYTISFRSGINDLLCGMGITNMTVIYPPNLEVIWANSVDFRKLHEYHKNTSNNEFNYIFNIHSLNRTFKANEINEIIYNYNDEFIVEQIIKHINGEI